MGRREDMIAALARGEIIEKYAEPGGSMVPKLYSRQAVTLEPASQCELKKGDIVFCKVKGNYYTHLISGIRKAKNGNTLYQISNNHKRVNGWIKKKDIFGIVTKIWPR